MILESTLVQEINTKIKFGLAMVTGESITVYPWSPKDIESKGKINMAIGSNTGLENITIYPRMEVI